MAKISILNLSKLANRSAAKSAFSENLASLKKFTEDQMPEIVKTSKTAQEELISSLEKLAQAAKTFQQNTGT